MARPKKIENSELADAEVANADPVPLQPTVAKPMIAKRKIRTVYGDMVDPLTGVRYGVIPQDIDVVSPWVQSQIDARKMVLGDA